MKSEIKNIRQLFGLPLNTWVITDARSVSAMLNGRGDGRHLIYEAYCLLQRYIRPHHNSEDHILNYSELMIAPFSQKLGSKQQQNFPRIVVFISMFMRVSIAYWRSIK